MRLRQTSDLANLCRSLAKNSFNLRKPLKDGNNQHSRKMTEKERFEDF